MNILLWVIQVALTLLYLASGVYKVFKTDDLLSYLRGFPRAGWQVLGGYELIGAVLLVLPARVSGMPSLNALAAAALALETLGLAVAFGLKSTKLVTANPFVWDLAIGLAAALVAWGRFVG